MGAHRDHPFCTRLLRGSSGLGLPAAQGCAGTPGREQSWQLCAVPLGSLWRSQMLARQRMGRRRAPGRAAEELGRDTRPSTARLPEELPYPTAGAVQAGRYLPGVSPAPSRCPCSLPTMGRRVPAATGTNLHRHRGQGARRAALQPLRSPGLLTPSPLQHGNGKTKVTVAFSPGRSSRGYALPLPGPLSSGMSLVTSRGAREGSRSPWEGSSLPPLAPLPTVSHLSKCIFAFLAFA